MKNILYILAIIGLITGCKQETPFPPGPDASLRFKKITSYVLDTISQDTIRSMISTATYDTKGKVKNVKMIQDGIEIRSIDFDYPSGNLLTFNVTPKDFYGQAISGGVIFDVNNKVTKIYDRNKADFGLVHLHERFFTYQNGKLATTHIPNGDAPESFGWSGYNYFEFVGNKLMLYRNASTLNDSTVSFFFLNGTQYWRDLYFEYYPNNEFINNFFINIDEYYDYETTSGAVSWSDFHNRPLFSTIQLTRTFQLLPFMPKCNFLGVEPDALISEKTVTGYRADNPNLPLYYKWQYSYEMDGQNRVIKKEQKTMSGQLLRVWYYEYEG